MNTISNILLPVDLSPSRVGAARYASALAQHYRAELTLIRVIEPSDTALPALDESERFQLNNILDIEQRRLKMYGPPEFADLSVKRLVLVGEAADLIVQQAGSDKTDLIVMPT